MHVLVASDGSEFAPHVAKHGLSLLGPPDAVTRTGPTICDVARELGVDTIVVGSHPRHGLGRLRHGSTAEQVVRHAPCAVLVVRSRQSPW